MSSQNSFIKYYNLETPYGNIHGMCKINNEIIATGIAWDTSYKPNRHNIFLFKCDLKGNLLKKILFMRILPCISFLLPEHYTFHA